MEGPRSRAAMREARAADGSRSVISRKELARQLRREAYQKAKAQRAADPKNLAMKEAAKTRRREVYQQVKARRKEGEAEQKAKRSAKHAEERAEERNSFAKRIKSALKNATGDGGAPVTIPSLSGEAGADEGDGADEVIEAPSGRRAGALQSQVRAALGNKRVSELLHRLRLVTNEPGVTANEAYSSSGAAPSSQSRHAREGSPD